MNTNQMSAYNLAQTNRIGAPVDTPGRQPRQVDGGLNRLEEIIGGLHKQTDVLSDRLGVVLLPPQPTADPSAKATLARAMASPAGERLVAVAGSLEALHARLVDLVDRLDF